MIKMPLDLFHLPSETRLMRYGDRLQKFKILYELSEETLGARPAIDAELESVLRVCLQCDNHEQPLRVHTAQFRAICKWKTWPAAQKLRFKQNEHQLLANDSVCLITVQSIESNGIGIPSETTVTHREEFGGGEPSSRRRQVQSTNDSSTTNMRSPTSSNVGDVLPSCSVHLATVRQGEVFNPQNETSNEHVQKSALSETDSPTSHNRETSHRSCKRRNDDSYYHTAEKLYKKQCKKKKDSPDHELIHQNDGQERDKLHRLSSTRSQRRRKSLIGSTIDFLVTPIKWVFTRRRRYR